MQPLYFTNITKRREHEYGGRCALRSFEKSQATSAHCVVITRKPESLDNKKN